MMKTPCAPADGAAPAPRALVAFGGQTDLAWLRLLKPGFRHCFALLERAPAAGGAGWVLYNPLSTGTQIELWPQADGAALAAHLRRQGYAVVAVRARAPGRTLYPWRPYTCVEAVKRALGIDAPWALTPWGLYRHLRESGERDGNEVWG